MTSSGPEETGGFSAAHAAELRVDGYRVRGVLGAGGHSTVYLADDAQGRAVALKRWRDGGDEARVAREARALQRLAHPNLVRFVALCRDQQGAPCLVMEHVRGRTLAEALQADGPLPPGPALPARVAALLAPLASALEHMHAHGLVHRDVKPANVILREGDGAPVLVDLSIVKATGVDPARLTTTGAPVGTSAYMAPEQCAGDLGPADARTDVYGLGATLFQALTGVPPWTHETGWERARRNPWRDPYPTQPAERARVLAARAAVPDGLGRLVARCLEGAPERRFRDMPALQVALRAAAAGPGPRRAGRVAAVGAAALAAAVLLVAARFRDPPPPLAPRTGQEDPMSRSVSAVLTATAAVVLTGVAPPREPPDGTRPAQAAAPMRIGGWTPEPCAKGELLIPLGPAGPGQYEVEWRYEGGPYGICVNECALLEDDVPISRDAHAGWAGSRPRRNTFLLRLEAVQPGARYALRADLRQPVGWGTDSHGSVWLTVRRDGGPR